MVMLPVLIALTDLHFGCTAQSLGVLFHSLDELDEARVDRFLALA